MNCGAWVTTEFAWGTVDFASGESPTHPPEPPAKQSAVKAKVKLEPLDKRDSGDFNEEVTDVGEGGFPRLSTDAIMDFGQPSNSTSSSSDAIMELTDRLETEAPAPSPTKPDKCGHCGAGIDLAKSRFCDACGVRAVKSPDNRTAKPRGSSKLVLRCRLCGYTVTPDAESCLNCGTPNSQ